MKAGEMTRLVEGILRHRETKKRDYIDASLIGSKCSRQIWYDCRGYDKALSSEPFKRALGLADKLKEMILDLLAEAGIALIRPDQLNSYLQFFHPDKSFFRGSPNAMFKNHEALVFIETASDASFSIFKNKGLHDWNEAYHAKAQACMGMSYVMRSYFICINNETHALHDELIEFNEEAYEELITRAIIVESADEPPPKVNNSAFYYLCKQCDFRETCHE